MYDDLFQAHLKLKIWMSGKEKAINEYYTPKMD
jgi:hypothetical protein